MSRFPVSDDIDATVELPTFDPEILSTQLERIELTPANAPSLLSSANWSSADQLAALKDQIDSLKAGLSEEHRRHARLSTRHQTLLDAMHEQEQALAALRKHADNLEHTIAVLKRELARSIEQRHQREQFILKQAEEIKRLREQR